MCFRCRLSCGVGATSAGPTIVRRFFSGSQSVTKSKTRGTAKTQKPGTPAKPKPATKAIDLNDDALRRVNRLIRLFAAQVKAKPFKITTSEYIRLLQVRKEFAAEIRPKDVEVTWVESQS